MTAAETTSVGHLAWEITQVADGKVLESGKREIKANEVQVISDESYLEQRIPLSGGFYLKLNSGRDEKPFIGFGMAGGKEDEETFCWEWFTVESPNRATKLQEKGELDFRSEKVGDYWEIARTRFVTDITMRVIQWSTRSKSPKGSEATWRVKILKDSEIEWPTAVQNKVLLVRDAPAWVAAHPPPPGFWDSLVKAAEQTTAPQESMLPADR